MSQHTQTVGRGIALAFVCLFILGVMPVISNGRPEGFDALGFAFFLSLWQLACALPVVALERAAGRSGLFAASLSAEEKRRTILVVIGTGAIFGLSTYIYVLAVEKAGTVSAALAIQAYPLFAMLWESLFLKRGKSPAELGFTLLLIAALSYLATGGSWKIDGLSVWFLLALAIPFLWSVAHVIIKEELGRTPITPAEVTFLRVLVSSIFLGAVALSGNGIGTTLEQAMNGGFQTFAIAMGVVYFVELLVWFYAVRSIDVSLASSITIPAPVVTMALAILFLGEAIETYELVGMGLVFVSLYGLLYAGHRRRKSVLA
ncbi:MAG: EamA family transporter [Hyphomicrobiales bacterium]|nr:MAG: EamA family transporter [Hyphomicrobiales bacterium]